MATTKSIPARPRLSDVASAAGVSTMTVARVLRDSEKVATATRERVERILRETGYTPDLLARGLASSRSGLVAVIVPVITHSLIAEIVEGLSESLATHDYHVVLGVSGFDLHEEERMIRAFLSRRVDAIYLSSYLHSEGSRKALMEAGIPVVEGINLGPKPIDMAVGYSNLEAAQTMTLHLLDRGYDPIGYIGPLPGDNDRAGDRLRGFESALRRRRRKPDPALRVEAALSVADGARAMGQLLDRSPRPRAVFCYSDVLAAGALFECQRRGIAVPDEVAIAGYDDLEIAGQTVPPLTSLRGPRYEAGKRAGEMLCRRLTGGVVRQKIVNTGFELVVRATT